MTTCSEIIPEVPYVELATSCSFDHPEVLDVSVSIFICSQSVSDTFDRIHDWASKVIRRVDLPFIPFSWPQALIFQKIGTNDTYPVRWWGMRLHL